MDLNRRPRLATAWLGGCSGCHMSFLDLDERLIDLAAAADICYSPLMDIKEFPEAVDIALVEGAVANEDHLRDLRTIRARSKTLIAFGDCAVTGNVTAMRNLFPLENILEAAYGDPAVVRALSAPPDPVPRLLGRVLRLHDVVEVDWYLPGCPPSADSIFEIITAVLAGKKPPGGRKFGC